MYDYYVLNTKNTDALNEKYNQCLKFLLIHVSHCQIGRTIGILRGFRHGERDAKHGGMLRVGVYKGTCLSPLPPPLPGPELNGVRQMLVPNTYTWQHNG